jgi:hypothetical protein
MLAAPTGVGLAVLRTEFFHFIRHFKRVFYSVLRLSGFTVSASLIVRLVSRSISGDLPYYGRAPGATSVLNSA